MFEKVRFENSFTRQLPADPISENTIRQVSNACFSRVKPQTVSAPKLAAWSPELVELLELAKPTDSPVIEKRYTEIFSGNQLEADMDSYAMCYGGHQFGNWAAQLGDGRAINLGEIVNSHKDHYTLQLKGAGPTPYSRMADGLAVLRSSIREFLCSEAMFHLGVPTTRALTLVTTGEDVVRDMFYDGHPKKEPGAVVCRVSSSFIRFGNFEILTSRRDFDLLKKLADFTIRQDFPHLGKPSKEVYAQWFQEICERTAHLMVEWERVGFVHGVMNTDNMSIIGETIDYGPYGWLEDYNPNWTPNTTDAGGKRYRFGNQKAIAQWNLAMLGNVLYPLLGDLEPLQNAVSDYARIHAEKELAMLANKLGVSSPAHPELPSLTQRLKSILQLTETDMTLFFRLLGDMDIDLETLEQQSPEVCIQPLLNAYYEPKKLEERILKPTHQWLMDYAKILDAEQITEEDRKKLMHSTNPLYVLRNYLAHQAIEKAEAGDFSMVHELQEVLRNPYKEQKGMEARAEKRPEWAKTKPGCSMLSCSS